MCRKEAVEDISNENDIQNSGVAIASLLKFSSHQRDEVNIVFLHIAYTRIFHNLFKI